MDLPLGDGTGKLSVIHEVTEILGGLEGVTRFELMKEVEKHHLLHHLALAGQLKEKSHLLDVINTSQEAADLVCYLHVTSSQNEVLERQ